MNKIKKFFRKLRRNKKEKNIVINQIVGVIQPTKVSMENNTIDKFNKVIIIREGVGVYGKEIRWGRIIKEEPYSEEKIKALMQINEIPIVERKQDGSFDFFQESDFGEVQTLI